VPALAGRVGSVNAQVVRVCRTWWAGILLLAIAVFAPVGLVDAVVGQIDPQSVDFSHGLTSVALVGALGTLAAALLGDVFYAGAISASLTHERPPTLAEVARRLSYGRLLAVAFLCLLLTVAGLFLAIFPGVLAFLFLALAGPAVELEQHSVSSALARSYHLVRADFWLVFWVLLPIALVGFLVYAGLEHFIHDLLGETFLTNWLTDTALNVIVSPPYAVATVVLATRLISVLDGSGPGIRSFDIDGTRMLVT
jgi:hypothetical protein